jgi:predicted metalloprotease with PDZ domain
VGTAPWRLLAAVSLAVAVPAGGPARAARAAEPAVRYVVAANEGAEELRVEATLRAGLGGELALDTGMGPFVRDPEVEERGSWRAVERGDDRLDVPSCRSHPCRIRYRFALAEAARAVHDRNRATEQQGAFLAPPSSWLARPLRDGEARFRLEVTTPPGTAFATGLFPASGDGAPAYEATLDDLEEAPYSGFGPFQTARISVRGGVVDMAIAPGERDLPTSALTAWAERAGRAVADYYEHYPVPRVLVLVLPTGRRAIGFGTTLGNGGAAIMIWVGRSATEADLQRDWVLTHEMIHTAFPNMPRTQRWLEEGIATYVEPIARARAGALRAEEVWRSFIEGLPKGMPRPGDPGLDEARNWGSTYWGGACFCFLADLQIREKTGNRRSLDDALRGINAAGGSIAVRWPLRRALEEGDRATGTHVLRELYDKMGEAPMKVDLDELWRRLGVVPDGRDVRFDDRAPLAAVRRSITAPPASGPPADGRALRAAPATPRP